MNHRRERNMNRSREEENQLKSEPPTAASTSDSDFNGLTAFFRCCFGAVERV